MIEAGKLDHMAAKATEFSTYVAGGGTAFGGFVGWLDQHAVAIGAICAFITMVANVYFRWREVRAKERQSESGA